MRSRQGFTLIELMIVIAIIAVIAAIAIPGLLQSQRASNERNASASLKTLASAEADFRGNDRDGNRIQDFWTGDMAQLYGMTSVGSTEMIKLIEISLAGANFCNPWPMPTAPAPGVGITYPIQTSYSILAPKAGYWYKSLWWDEIGQLYMQETSGVNNAAGTLGTPGRNHSKFAFLAFPDSFSSGRSLFYINEENTIFKRATLNSVRPPTPGPLSALLPNYLGAGALQAERWPSDAALKAYFSKLD
jgi:prepilin-type N-terminal cleavage/methylation domain-containing protein